MTNKLTALTLALCIAASILFGAIAMAQPHTPAAAVTMCDLECDDDDL